MFFGIAIDGLILGFLLLIFLRENIEENLMPAVAAVGIPSVISLVPAIYFDGAAAWFLRLTVFLGLFYWCLKEFFDLAPAGVLKLMGIFIIIKVVMGFTFRILLSA